MEGMHPMTGVGPRKGETEFGTVPVAVETPVGGFADDGCTIARH